MCAGAEWDTIKVIAAYLTACNNG